MKKALAMGLGALLAVGSAATASAASQIDFSGLYRLYSANAWNNQFTSSEAKTNDSGFFNRLQLTFGFHATDEVSVYWQMRAPHANRWGQSGANPSEGGNYNAANTVYAYGEVKQDWGTVSVGKLSSDFSSWNLVSLGWAPSGADGAYTAVRPFSIDAEIDGIAYVNRWDNGFQLVAEFLRSDTARTWSGEGTTPGDQADTDIFGIEPAFFWDDGGASLGLFYANARTYEAKTRTAAKFEDNLGRYVDWGEGGLRQFWINPAISHSWGDFSVHATGKFSWAKKNEDKVEGYALYLDFDYNYGPGNVNLAGWYASGTKADGTDTKYKSLVDMGTFFRPLVVAYVDSDLNGGSRARSGNAVAIANSISGGEANEESGTANHWAVNFSGKHGLSDDITVNYALAYLALNKVVPGASKSIGWEADLGFNFKLLDNLSFNTTFGYLFTGKAFDGSAAWRNEKGLSADYSAADAYSWYSTLNFTF